MAHLALPAGRTVSAAAHNPPVKEKDTVAVALLATIGDLGVQEKNH